MNILLLLSALLSALSGVGQAVRGVRVPQAVCASIEVGQASVAARRADVAPRPAQPLPDVFGTVVPRLSPLRLVPAEPIFAGRRRE